MSMQSAQITQKFNKQALNVPEVSQHFQNLIHISPKVLQRDQNE